MAKFGLRSWILFPLGVIILFAGVALVNISMRQKVAIEKAIKSQERFRQLWDGGEAKDGLKVLGLYERWHDHEWEHFNHSASNIAFRGLWKTTMHRISAYGTISTIHRL